MLEILLALNFQAPDCPDYWIRPDTQRVECLYQDGGRLVNVQPVDKGELFLRENGSNYWVKRSDFVKKGTIVQFPLVQELPRPIKGVSQVSYWYRVDCRSGQSAIDFVNVGDGWVRNTTAVMRSHSNVDAQRLVKEVCR
jgi:hypothetical protein